MRRGAFTLTEILVTIAIMSIMAAVMTLSSSSVGKHTAKREAERVASFISAQLRKVQTSAGGFQLNITDNNKMNFVIGKKSNTLNASKGCSYEQFYAKNSTIYNTTQGLYYINKPNYYRNWSETSAEDITIIKTSINKEGKYYIQVKGEDGKICNVTIGR